MAEFTQEEREYFMREALKEAQKSLAREETPIGCVIVKNGVIIGRRRNVHEEYQRTISCTEIMAIDDVNENGGSWRLLDNILFVTVEPYVMYNGAIRLTRIPQVTCEAANQKFDGTSSLHDILADVRLNHRVEVETGILETECAAITQDFFRKNHKKKRAAKQAAKEQS